MQIADTDRKSVLRFAASFLWADLDVAPSEHAFFRSLAKNLGGAEGDVSLDAPPSADSIDPTRVSPELADTVRDVALKAIAADGVVTEDEMELFDLLDELLPRKDRPRDDATE
ncbi:MAG TPA: hypothetical protein VIF62_02735 [Labilithrix sp.]